MIVRAASLAFATAVASLAAAGPPTSSSPQVSAIPAPGEQTARGDRLLIRDPASRTVTIEQREGAVSRLVRVPVTSIAQR
jgi:hypothetical protein